MIDQRPESGERSESWWEERAEAFEGWADSVASAHLELADTRALQAITRLSELRKEVDAAILDAVREARRERSTWAEIGAMLGVTRQAAQRKYALALAADRPEAAARFVDEGEPQDRETCDAPRDPSPREAGLEAARTAFP